MQTTDLNTTASDYPVRLNPNPQRWVAAGLMLGSLILVSVIWVDIATGHNIVEICQQALASR